MSDKILIIGAGATGLMAARLLAKAGHQVTVLEGRERCGGRIHTLNNEGGFEHVELGAEFIHGDLPVTLNLLKEAGIPYHPAGGEMWRYTDGKFSTDESPTPYWDELLERLNELETDTNIHHFLQQEFPDEKYEALRLSVERYAAGYDTADPKLASAFALRNEWQHEDEGAQHRLKGGYAAMIDFLEKEIRSAGGTIILNSPVKTINWDAGSVNAVTTNGTVYDANKLLVALPLGVLKLTGNETGTVQFDPPIPNYNKALQTMGFGSIIKILLQFDEPFWLDEHTTQLAGKSADEMGFIISDQPLPTWWTQAPKTSGVLTGWLGGPPSAELNSTSEDDMLKISLQSLAVVFKRDVQWLKNRLTASAIVNWNNDPFTRGSYAYDTVGAPEARALLNQPIENTLFFAGEYLYEGTAMGTVEAALTSAVEIVNRQKRNAQ